MFFVYPNNPEKIGQLIENALIEVVKSKNITSWKAMEIAGAFIRDKVLEKIDRCEIVIADITKLNFNVTYEIGYSIGKRKPIVLTINKSLNGDHVLMREVGIFDTIGYLEYENTSELIKILKNPKTHAIHSDKENLNIKAPVYLLDTKHKTDYSNRISARIKKARLMYRSFDPNESPRLSAYDAINQVSQSYGVVVPLLDAYDESSQVHNLRAAFIAGLATGLNKITSILQFGNDPIPIDFRDFVNVYNQVNDINSYIAEFADNVVEALQESEHITNSKDITYLQKLDFGASAAENEMGNLQAYYLKTDAYLRATRGEVQLVIGRKGSGKSAIFLQLRDKERSSGKNVVLDLKPEGYKLIKFKELVLDLLEEGTFHHTIMAFWEYILLMEICHKVLDNDKKRYINQTELIEPYTILNKLYHSENYLTEGDFSERLAYLMDNIKINLHSKHGENSNLRLSVPEVTDLIFKTDIKVLRNNLISYLRHKEKVWLLFDNIDKGWPTTGLVKGDLVIIRTLIDATRKIQRSFNNHDISIYPLLFLRNDVYELLVSETSDRQKEEKVLLDWVDSELLRSVIKLRIEASIGEEVENFESVWRNICTSHFNGEETSQYLIDRCLMRPRFLINLINQCKSFAINLNHKKIEKEDIQKGVDLFSTDLLTDIGYEIRDILPQAENILYGFINSNVEMKKSELEILIKETLKSEDSIEKIIELLLWYGFLGIKTDTLEIKYIYNLNYNMQLFKGYIQKMDNSLLYVINPAFRPGLMIAPTRD